MENYEQKYKDLLERARESLKDDGISQNMIAYMKSIYLELIESEEQQ